MKLSVINPNREAPTDIAYKSKAEFAFCEWCKFHSYDRWDYPWHRCYNRNIIKKPQDVDAYIECRDVNPNGKCEFYKPTKWTRIVRWFGFRKTVWR